MMTIQDFHQTWNELHIQCTAANPESRNEEMAKWLESQILNAKTLYYNTESPIMEDRVYDKMEDYLRILNPDSDVLKRVGA